VSLANYLINCSSEDTAKMYIDAIFHKESETIKVVERTKKGQRVFKEYPTKYQFYIPDARGRHRSVYGDPLTKITCNSNKEFRKELAIHSNKQIFESDLNQVFTCLSDNYLGQDAPRPNIAFFDIETDMQPYAWPSGHMVKIKDRNQVEKEITVFTLGRLPDRHQYQVYDETDRRWVPVAGCRYLEGGPGYAPSDDPFMPITAISVHLQWLDMLVCLAVPPKTLTHEQALAEIEGIPNVLLFKNDAEMLNMFLDLIEDADILSGWNSEGFDIPYTVNRIARVLSKDDTRRLCLWDQYPKRREYEKFGNTAVTYDLVGRVHLDSLELYRKYNYEERHSYRLDAIGEMEIGENKVPYEGTLDQLYNTDFRRFIEYNRQDTALLNKLDLKLKFIDTAVRLAHECTVLLSTTMGSVAVIEQAIINECHALGVQIPNRRRREDSDDRAAGAYVAYPKKGLHDYVGSLDINSLYPSTIRRLNMAPETIVGQLRPVITDAYIAQRIDSGTSFAEAWEGLFGTFEYDAVIKQDIGTEIIIDWEDGHCSTHSAAEVYRLIFESNQPFILSANGTIFTSEKQGVIPGLLGKWYAERKMLQKEKKVAAELTDGISVDQELLAELKR